MCPVVDFRVTGPCTSELLLVKIILFQSYFLFMLVIMILESTFARGMSNGLCRSVRQLLGSSVRFAVQSQ
jgi:hypothetical protein